MPVEIAWQVDERPLADDEVARTVEAALVHGGRPAAPLGVVFVSDAALTELHGAWLQDATPTDVITFDLGEDPAHPDALVGELYVSVECALRCAAQRAVPPARELALYLVHGVLHLCGFDDHEPAERARMRAAESAVLEALGHARDEFE